MISFVWFQCHPRLLATPTCKLRVSRTSHDNDLGCSQPTKVYDKRDPQGSQSLYKHVIFLALTGISQWGKPITWGRPWGGRKASPTSQLAPGLETRPPQRWSHQRPCRTHSPVISGWFPHLAVKDWFFYEDYPSESGSKSCVRYIICSSSTHLSIQYLSPAPSLVPVA